tara:strand:- start:596 stop:745 length:150 start_codon:yes stop_codon:yes gene_type:complete
MEDNKDKRNFMWAEYTKDVINKGLRDEISFDLYCGRILNPSAYSRNQFK